MNVSNILRVGILIMLTIITWQLRNLHRATLMNGLSSVTIESKLDAIVEYQRQQAERLE